MPAAWPSSKFVIAEKFVLAETLKSLQRKLQAPFLSRIWNYPITSDVSFDFGILAWVHPNFWRKGRARLTL